MDLSNMENEMAFKLFLENAVIYTDTKGNTRKLTDIWETVDLTSEVEQLIANVGRENVHVYSINSYWQLLEGYRWADTIRRFATTKYFKLPHYVDFEDLV